MTSYLHGTNGRGRYQNAAGRSSILLLGATQTLVTHNFVTGTKGTQFNSGGIVVLSARAISHGSNPNFDTIAGNTAFRNRPADLIWDGTGIGVRFRANQCQRSIPSGFCH
jgi:hypothetical protein